MKSVFFLCLLLASWTQASDGVIRRLVWQVETADPVQRHWPVVYGETFDMEVRYLDHGQPMDLAGSTAVLHCRTNGMAADTSFQATGSVMAAEGWATVRVSVSTLLPPGLSQANYVIAVTKSGATNLLVASGFLNLSGSGSGIYGAPLPAPVAAELSDRIDAVNGDIAGLRVQVFEDAKRWTDSSDTNVFARLVNGTGTVYKISRQWALIANTALISYPDTVLATAGVYRLSSAVLRQPANGAYTASGLQGSVDFYNTQVTYNSGLWYNFSANYASGMIGFNWALNADGIAYLQYLIETNEVSKFGYASFDGMATTQYVNTAVSRISAPVISRDGVNYRQYWDTNALTTAWGIAQ